MHRLASHAAAFRMRIASLLVCARFILVPTTLGSLMYALLSNNQEMAFYALALIPITLVVLLLQALLSVRTNCPLCMTSMLGEKSCNKHTNAKRLFGSYKLRVACAVLFCKSFRCPYCNEPATLKVRVRR